MFLDLQAAIDQQLVRRNGEVLRHLLTMPHLSGVVVTDDDGDEYGPDAMLNEGGQLNPGSGLCCPDPDDYSSGEYAIYNFGFPHFR